MTPTVARSARSTRLYARPGRPFYEAGATASDDYTVLALAAAPEGARVLEPAAALPTPGDPCAWSVCRRGGRCTRPSSPAESSRPTPARSPSTSTRPSTFAAGVARRCSTPPAGCSGCCSPPDPARAGARGSASVRFSASCRPWPSPTREGCGRLFATVAPDPSAANNLVARGRTPPPGADPSLHAAERVDAATRALPSAQGPRSLTLRVEQPAPDATVGDGPGVFVAGRAVESLRGSQRFDVVVVIDTSSSTALPAGVDVDGDGTVGQPPREGQPPGSTDPDDSILAAEVAAAKTLVTGLDPLTTRVGVVTFAGQAEATRTGKLLRIDRAAVTREPLTSDPRRLRRALDAVQEDGASGMTYMAAGIDLATLELLGLEGALSRNDPESTKAILFFTDGEPTLPSLDSAAANVGAVFAAAQRARRAGVRIDSFAIGPEALAGPLSTVEMASITEGLFTPVRHPGSLVRSMSLVSFARVESLTVRNAHDATGRLRGAPPSGRLLGRARAPRLRQERARGAGARLRRRERQANGSSCDAWPARRIRHFLRSWSRGRTRCSTRGCATCAPRTWTGRGGS